MGLAVLAVLLGMLSFSGFMSLMAGMGVRGASNLASTAAAYAGIGWLLAGGLAALLSAYRLAAGQRASGFKLALAPVAAALTLPLFSAASLALLTPEPQPVFDSPPQVAEAEPEPAVSPAAPKATSISRFLPLDAGPGMGLDAYLSALKAARDKGVSLDHMETTHYLPEDARVRGETDTLELQLGFAEPAGDPATACAQLPMQFLPLLDSPDGNPVGRAVIRAACTMYGPRMELDLWIDRDELLVLAGTSYSEIDGRFDPVVITGRFGTDQWVQLNLANRPPVWLDISAVKGLTAHLSDVTDIANRAAMIYRAPPFGSDVAREPLVVLTEPNELSAAILAIEPGDSRRAVMSTGLLSGEYMRVDVITYTGDEIGELDDCSMAKLAGSDLDEVQQVRGWVRYRDGGRAAVGFIENPCGC